MIAPTPFFSDRGCHIRILEEAKILKKLGHEITIYTYHLGKNIEGIKIKRIKEVRSYNKLDAGPSYKKIYLDYLLLIKLLKEVKKKEYDIIHAHLHEGALIGKIVRKFKGIPLVFDYQGSLVKEMQDHGYLKNKIAKKIFQSLEKIITKNNDFILTSSTESKNQLEKEKITNVTPLLDAVDTQEFKYIENKRLKSQYNLESKKVVVFLGVLNKYQGIDLLIDTIPLVKKEIEDIHFLIAGYPNIEKYKELVKKLGVENITTFTGRIDYNLAPDIISLGDVAISLKLSSTEANGKLYNYMACGIPTIATDNSINREILKDAGIYTSQNPEEISKKIVDLIKNKNLRFRLSKYSLEISKKYHSWESRGKQLEEIYKKCLKYQ